MRDSALYDAIVIGGGPAGSTTAALLAAAGHRVVVVERERFPRFHVGESLLPASQPILERLGVARQVACEGFVVKPGATFLFEDGSTGASIAFARGFGSHPGSTYQVPRDRFDEILLEAAKRRGAELRQGWRAGAVDFGPEKVALDIHPAGRRADEVTERLEGRYLVDASGQAGFLAKRLDLRCPDPALANVAVYSHYEGVCRLEGVPRGNIQVISRRDLGWLWLIPLSDTLTSVGAVVPQAVFREWKGRGKETVLDEIVTATPVLARQLASARRVIDARFEADFSYGCRSWVGDRWILAGDAGSFLDPVFSTGVQLALESGAAAAEALDAALTDPRRKGAAFARYQTARRRRHRHFRRYVRSFYDPAFRDLLCEPTERLGMIDAMTSILAGDAVQHWSVRWRLALFFLLVRLQRRWPLAPRRHLSLVPAES